MVIFIFHDQCLIVRPGHHRIEHLEPPFWQCATELI
uniref:Uncharacterized protein n=1 Tax=Arundo donax TaxID=35708 RepID=A0A0A8Y3T7_ARUDO